MPYALAGSLKGPAGNPGQAWPVGGVFIAVVPTNPATLLGYGTWAAFGTGRVLVGQDPADPSFDVAEEIGGSKTVTPAGTVSQPTFTGAALATHTHGVGTLVVNNHTTAADSNTTGGTAKVTGPTTHTLSGSTAAVSAGTPSGTVSQPTFTGSAMSVVQPYIVVYMWKRTA